MDIQTSWVEAIWGVFLSGKEQPTPLLGKFSLGAEGFRLNFGPLSKALP